MKATGTFRCYFNRHQAAPLVWCVTLMVSGAPLWEIAVKGIGFDGVRVETVYDPKKTTPDDEDGMPSAWLDVQGELEVLADGCAVIRAEVLAA